MMSCVLGVGEGHAGVAGLTRQKVGQSGVDASLGECGQRSPLPCGSGGAAVPSPLSHAFLPLGLPILERLAAVTEWPEESAGQRSDLDPVPVPS